jgi:hypothetical protein
MVSKRSYDSSFAQRGTKASSKRLESVDAVSPAVFSVASANSSGLGVPASTSTQSMIPAIVEQHHCREGRLGSFPISGWSCSTPWFGARSPCQSGTLKPDGHAMILAETPAFRRDSVRWLLPVGNRLEPAYARDDRTDCCSRHPSLLVQDRRSSAKKCCSGIIQIFLEPAVRSACGVSDPSGKNAYVAVNSGPMTERQFGEDASDFW